MLVGLRMGGQVAPPHKRLVCCCCHLGTIIVVGLGGGVVAKQSQPSMRAVPPPAWVVAAAAPSLARGHGMHPCVPVGQRGNQLSHKIALATLLGRSVFGSHLGNGEGRFALTQPASMAQQHLPSLNKHNLVGELSRRGTRAKANV